MVNFNKFPNEVAELISTNNSLQTALRRLANGTPDTPRSWFYESIKDPGEILGILTQKLKGMKDLNSISEWDLSKSGKFGPQGRTAPFRDRLSTFDEYFQHVSSPGICSDPIWQRAKRLVIQRLKLNETGSPIASKAVIDRGLGEDKYNTNSGYPLYLKRKTPAAIEHALTIGMDSIRMQYPFTLGSRATMGKVGENARFIFMAPMAVNVQGQRYQMPLQDYLRSLGMDFFMPWEGWDSVQSTISANWSGTVKFGADYTKMDQHFTQWHAREVWEVVRHYFRPEYWDELWTLMKYPFIAPIITSEGLVTEGHALASGSEWTNFVETVWNYIFTVYLELKYHLKFKAKMGIGDDQLWFLEMSDSEKAINWITQIVVREMDYAGLPGNQDKQEVSASKTGFLQRGLFGEWNGLDGNIQAAGVYSLIRNATSQVFPERYHNEKDWDRHMFALRTIMIAENCNQHPLFRWYVQDFVANANRNILEFVRESDQVLASVQDRAKNIASFLPTYNQEKQGQSILTFETVRLLREVA